MLHDRLKSLALKTSDQLVTKRLDTLLKSVGVVSGPVRLVTRDGVLASKADVKNVVLAMTIVTSQSIIGVAELSKRDGCFAGRIRAVGITPDAVKLQQISPAPTPTSPSEKTYQLITTNHGHHTKRLHAILLGIEVRVSKDHIRMNIGIQVLEAILAQ